MQELGYCEICDLVSENKSLGDMEMSQFHGESNEMTAVLCTLDCCCIINLCTSLKPLR